ncbi:MAG: zf-HC2 domain-containing protein [Gemmatimonadales bacterium]
MDCREFREKHFAYVDDTLSGIELVGLQVHLSECEACARQDATVRRSLMLFRSLPSIQPSPDFSLRLQQRLDEVKMTDLAALQSGRSRRFAAALTLTSAVMLGYIGVSLRQVDSPQDISFPPVVATAQEQTSNPIARPAPEMVAAVPAGIPIWTAALFAEQTPIHFASIDLTAAAR